MPLPITMMAANYVATIMPLMSRLKAPWAKKYLMGQNWARGGALLNLKFEEP
jgi:hypothetical protein